MKISRRAILGAGLGVAVAATAGVAAIAGPIVRRGGGKYQPGPGDIRLKGPGDMVMQSVDGRWRSHMLPFAAPATNRTAVLAELQAARAQRLIA